MSTVALERIPQDRAITPLGLIQDALKKNVAPEVLKELVSLQQSMIRFEWEAQERQSKIDFDDALNTCQSQIGRVAPNVHRENNIWWADYPQLDRTVRPIYIGAGFSIGFSEVEGKDSSRMRMCATLSRGGVSREYFAEISRTPASSKMSQADADASAASRVKRYLLLDIFNISIGIDKDEKQGIVNSEALDWVSAIEGSATPGETMEVWTKATASARKVEDYKSMTIFTEARDKRLLQFKKERQ